MLVSMHPKANSEDVFEKFSTRAGHCSKGCPLTTPLHPFLPQFSLTTFFISPTALTDGPQQTWLNTITWSMLKEKHSFIVGLTHVCFILGRVDLRCSHLTRPHICTSANECTTNFDCNNGQICCPNGCGGKYCQWPGWK